MNVQVHDPMVEPREAVEEYGIKVLPRNKLKPADAVVFAVAHQTFIDEGWNLVAGLLKGGKGVVADVKGRLPRKRVPPGISLWRL